MSRAAPPELCYRAPAQQVVGRTEMDTKVFLQGIVDPGLKFLEEVTGIPVSDRARVLVMAIAGQESNWQYRVQIGGPAHSFWQFEKGGGVVGVLTHPASKNKIAAVCKRLHVICDASTVYTDMIDNDLLACSMARLLLLTDPAALPDVGQEHAAWDYYQRNWRPGMPHPEAWHAKYSASQLAIA